MLLTRSFKTFFRSILLHIFAQFILFPVIPINLFSTNWHRPNVLLVIGFYSFFFGPRSVTQLNTQCNILYLLKPTLYLSILVKGSVLSQTVLLDPHFLYTVKGAEKAVPRLFWKNTPACKLILALRSLVCFCPIWLATVGRPGQVELPCTI